MKFEAQLSSRATDLTGGMFGAAAVGIHTIVCAAVDGYPVCGYQLAASATIADQAQNLEREGWKVLDETTEGPDQFGLVTVTVEPVDWVLILHTVARRLESMVRATEEVRGGRDVLTTAALQLSPLTVEEIGKSCGLTRSRVYQVAGTQAAR